MHLEYMKTMNIDAAVVSLSSPDVHFEDKMKTREFFRKIGGTIMAAYMR